MVILHKCTKSAHTPTVCFTLKERGLTTCLTNIPFVAASLCTWTFCTCTCRLSCDKLAFSYKLLLVFMTSLIGPIIRTQAPESKTATTVGAESAMT